jgi:hypothetical protein
MSLGSVVVWHWWWLLVVRRVSPGLFGLLIEVAPSRPASLYGSREGPSRGPTLHGSGSWQWRLGSVVVWPWWWLLVVRRVAPGLFGLLIEVAPSLYGSRDGPSRGPTWQWRRNEWRRRIR